MAERWSYHLENRPDWATGEAEGFAKSIYDNQSIDPNAELQKRASAFRQQYGDAPRDDASVFRMMATGQRPQAKAQSPAAQWNAQPAAQANPQNDALMKLLMERATQGTAVNRMDPNIRQQVDPMVAQQERASRNYIDDLAERGGPMANLQGEKRLASERAGQAAGSLESEVIGREVAAKRGEIEQAIALLMANGQFDKAQQLQFQLASMSDASRAADRSQANDHFMRELALREFDTNNAWDYRWTMGG
jgi:hypothetical protein